MLKYNPETITEKYISDLTYEHKWQFKIYCELNFAICWKEYTMQNKTLLMNVMMTQQKYIVHCMYRNESSLKIDKIQKPLLFF